MNICCHDMYPYGHCIANTFWLTCQRYWNGKENCKQRACLTAQFVWVSLSEIPSTVWNTVAMLTARSASPRCSMLPFSPSPSPSHVPWMGAATLWLWRISSVLWEPPWENYHHWLRLQLTNMCSVTRFVFFFFLISMLPKGHILFLLYWYKYLFIESE